MRDFSIRTAWLSSVVLVLGCLLATEALALAKTTTIQSYRLQVRGQQGYFLDKPLSDLATSRVYVDAEQRIKGRSTNWNVLLSGRLRVEGAYGQNESRYSADVASQESSELELRDAYLQYSQGGFLARVGNQTVVWGEAFGFFYSDLVNPKDLRESTLSGLVDLADLRKPIPMLNLQWLGDKTTLQALYAIGPTGNKIPDLNSPYSPISQSSLPSGELQLVDKTDSDSSDWGARIGHNFGNLDTSVFWFHHRDRMPFEKAVIRSLAPLAIDIELHQKEVDAVGVTATWQMNEHLLRFEEVSWLNRRFNTLQASQLATEDSDNHVAVLGWDLPEWSNWRLGAQYSYDLIFTDSPTLGRRQTEQLFSTHVYRESAAGHWVDLIHAVSVVDGSSLTTLKAAFARSSNLEFLFGLESMQGKTQSQFGRFQNGSRVLIGLRGAFDG